jgi:cation diffusion facilitator family transporter
MGTESILRLLSPETIRFNEAILVAVIGLVVNLVSAWLLHGGRGHTHHHDSDRHHHEGHHDHNLRAAYLHVLADALTSLLAIVALFTGKYFGWIWMDALMGLIGAALITRWGYGLVRETSSVLLDEIPSGDTLSSIRRAIESDGANHVSDLHLWRIGPRHFGVIVSLVTHDPREPEHYKARLKHLANLSHVTVEVNLHPVRAETPVI